MTCNKVLARRADNKVNPMQITSTPPPPFSAPPAAPAAVHPRPGSALCCHVFAWLSAVLALILLMVSISGQHSDAPYAAIGCFAGAIVWWALGDIVASLDRIARR